MAASTQQQLTVLRAKPRIVLALRGDKIFDMIPPCGRIGTISLGMSGTVLIDPREMGCRPKQLSTETTVLSTVQW
jgi:hypothetical protein